MLFYLIHFSICKLTYEFTSKSHKNLLLYIEPNDIIEISLKNNLGAFFSSWENFKNMTIEVYTSPVNESQPEQTFQSNNGLIGVAFRYNDFFLRILNDGMQSYKLYILICDFIPNPNTGNNYIIPKGFSMPILKYAEKSNLKNIDDLIIPYIFSYDSSTSNCKPMIIAMMVIMGLMVFGVSGSFMFIASRKKEKEHIS